LIPRAHQPLRPHRQAPPSPLAACGDGKPRDWRRRFRPLLNAAAGTGDGPKAQLALHRLLRPERAVVVEHGDRSGPEARTLAPSRLVAVANEAEANPLAGRAPRAQRGLQRLSITPLPARRLQRRSSRSARRANPGPATDEASRAAANRGARSVGHQGGLRGEQTSAHGSSASKGPAAMAQPPLLIPAAFWRRRFRPTSGTRTCGFVAGKNHRPAAGFASRSVPHRIPPTSSQRAGLGSATRQHGGDGNGPACRCSRPAPAAAGDPVLGRRCWRNGRSGGQEAPPRASTLRPEVVARAHWPGDRAPLRP